MFAKLFDVEAEEEARVFRPGAAFFEEPKEKPEGEEEVRPKKFEEEMLHKGFRKSQVAESGIYDPRDGGYKTVQM